jgi:hypothetical protein
MKRSIMVTAALVLGVLAQAKEPATTPYTVVAKVTSYEHYRAFGGSNRFSQATPHGNEYTVVAIIQHPESLEGREIGIPFESRKDGKELLVQPGTVFRFEHPMNLADLRRRTDPIRRRGIAFPELGIVVLTPDGEVAETHDGSVSALAAKEAKKRAEKGESPPK